MYRNSKIIGFIPCCKHFSLWFYYSIFWNKHINFYLPKPKKMLYTNWFISHFFTGPPSILIVNRGPWSVMEGAFQPSFS